MKKNVLRAFNFAIIAVIAALAVIGSCDDGIDGPSPNNKGDVDRFLGVKYKVTFNGNGVTVSPSSDTTDANGNITLPSAPKKDGYTFDGWYTAATGGNEVTRYTVFDKNTTIYARWTLITYTITFDSRGGSVNPTYDTTVAGGKLASLPTPTQDGYKFNGWFTSSSGGTAVSASTVFDRNTTIYAQWTLVTYTITFSPNSGSVSPTSGTTGEGGRLSSLPTPTRSGYAFDGWYTSSSGGNEVTTYTVFEKNTTIYARWTLVTYEITFDANGGSVSSTYATTGTGGRLSSLPTPTRTGYTFVGWFTSWSGGTEVTASTAFDGNMTIYAQWTEIKVNQYTITFSANGGSGSPPSQLTVDEGRSVTLPNQGGLSMSGYTFNGWNTSSSGSGTNYSAGSSYSPTGNVTLYAKWTSPIVTTFGDSRDGKNYKKVTIGTQTWMAENLNYDVEGSKCYDNDPVNCAKYGRLYNWATAMGIDESYNSTRWNGSDVKHRGVCPVGWHLPSDAEWTTLTDAVGGSSTAGGKLKSTSGWYNNGNGSDSYGFSALPGGYGSSGGGFGNAGYDGYWWSATETVAYNAWTRHMLCNRENVFRDGYDKTSLLSVRCVQD